MPLFILQSLSQLIYRALVIAASPICFFRNLFSDNLTMTEETNTLFLVALDAFLLLASELLFALCIAQL
jgi:hypothetical protein